MLKINIKLLKLYLKVYIKDGTKC